MPIYPKNRSLPKPVYMTPINDVWGLCQQDELLRTFNTQEELLEYCNNGLFKEYQNPVSIELKNPPRFVKIGHLYFGIRKAQKLKISFLRKRIIENSCRLETTEGELISQFDSIEEMEEWISVLKNGPKPNQKKALAKPDENQTGILEEPTMENRPKRKANKLNKNKATKVNRNRFIPTEAYNNMKRDSDWWREQS